MRVKFIAVRMSLYLMVALGLTGGGFQVFAQHIHLAAGAKSTAQDGQLYIVNGTTYDINSTPPNTSCLFMSQDDPILYPGLYRTDATFVVLPATLWTGGPAPSAPAPGSYIELRLVSATGPGGGEIGLWEESIDGTATTKLISLPVGTSNGTNHYNLSEGDPGQGVSTPDGLDPYGHIHGRQFTASKPGLYMVGVQLLDTSKNGVNGGPIQAPSATNYFYFQAGLFVDSMARTNNTVTVRFGTRAFNNYFLEVNTNLVSTNWFPIEEVFGGNHSDLHYLIDSNATTSARFYRMHEIPQ